MTRFLPTVAMLGAAALATSAFSTPAYADQIVSESVTITFDINELATLGNADRALANLERQARKACTTTQPILHTQRVDEICVNDVMEQVLTQIDSAALTDAYQLANAQTVSTAEL